MTAQDEESDEEDESQASGPGSVTSGHVSLSYFTGNNQINTAYLIYW